MRLSSKVDEVLWSIIKEDIDYIECANCKSDKDLTIHHIKPVSKYPELKLEPSNLQVLCKKCHDKVHGKVLLHKNETKPLNRSYNNY